MSKPTAWLFDTCLLSEIRKKQVNTGVVAWLSSINPAEAYVSVASIAELAVGVEKLRAQADARMLGTQAWVDNIKRSFAKNTLAVDDATWQLWSVWQGQALASGYARPGMDSLLVATAQQHGLTIVTRNVRDFAPYPHLHNPWVEGVAA